MEHSYFITEFYAFFVVLCRLIGMMSFMPFLSASEISARFRLFAALSFAFMITPILAVTVDTTLDFTHFAILLARELVIGAFIGIVGRLLMSVLDLAGTLISGFLGLNSATSMNPNMQGSSLVSMILVMFGTMFFLASDLHHLMLVGLIKSYTLFPIDGKIVISDMTQGFTLMMSKCFWIGVQLSLPFLIAFMVMQVAFGLMNRMIPQMQIFFVSLPLQLWGGLVIMLITGSAMLVSFSHVFEDEFSQFFKIT